MSSPPKNSKGVYLKVLFFVITAFLLFWLFIHTPKAPTVKQKEAWSTHVSFSQDEPILPTVNISNLVITVFWFDNLEQLRLGIRDESALGYSECGVYEESRNFAHCDLFLVMPKMVDDEWVNTVGHEVLHGMFGAYHSEDIEEDFLSAQVE